jgi:hypothetical protein
MAFAVEEVDRVDVADLKEGQSTQIDGLGKSGMGTS